MQRVSVKLEEDMVDRLDGLADEHGVTRSDVIRDTLDDGLNTDDDAEIQHLEDEIEDLKRENERLRNEKRTIIQQREEHTDLVRTVERQQSLAERKARAGLLTKTKWAIFGMSDEEDE